MSNTVYSESSLSPDLGLLKRSKGEYGNLQNFRGWGKKIAKRRGIQFSQSQESGIMGIFDLRNDGDPLSPDKILVVNGDGEFVLYQYSEFITVFNFLFATGFKLVLQSPDLTWWSVAPNTTTGIPESIVISTPVSTISTDLEVSQSQYFGFQNTSNIYRFTVDSGTGSLQVTSFAYTTGTVVYSQNQAFVNGVGPVFQDETLSRWRLQINNSGALITTSI